MFGGLNVLVYDYTTRSGAYRCQLSIMIRGTAVHLRTQNFWILHSVGCAAAVTYFVCFVQCRLLRVGCCLPLLRHVYAALCYDAMLAGCRCCLCYRCTCSPCFFGSWQGYEEWLRHMRAFFAWGMLQELVFSTAHGTAAHVCFWGTGACKLLCTGSVVQMRLSCMYGGCCTQRHIMRVGCMRASASSF
jgi:hypothetical protein